MYEIDGKSAEEIFGFPDYLLGINKHNITDKEILDLTEILENKLEENEKLNITNIN